MVGRSRFRIAILTFGALVGVGVASPTSSVDAVSSFTTGTCTAGMYKEGVPGNYSFMVWDYTGADCYRVHARLWTYFNGLGYGYLYGPEDPDISVVAYSSMISESGRAKSTGTSSWTTWVTH